VGTYTVFVGSSRSRPFVARRGANVAGIGI
jgi:hypothetical protein